MERILSAYRRRIGDFEVVEVDEKQIGELRQRLDIDAPVEVHWTWDYGSQAGELRALYERGKRGQWNAEDDLDWGLPVPSWDGSMIDIDNELLMLPQILKAMGADPETRGRAAAHELAYVFSQLLHGEQAALQICGQLTNVCPTIDAKLYASSQVADEARHVEVIAKLLERKLGTLYPVGPTLKELLDQLLTAPTWKTKTLGMQTLFEGMAVAVFDGLGKASRTTLLTDILRRVKVDEARHTAFGILTMRRVMREASDEERAELEDFAFSILETLNANQNLDMLRTLGPRYGIDPEAIVQLALGLPEWSQLNSKVFMHTVIPNLSRLGLITERTEDAYRERGIIHGDRFGHAIDPDVAAAF